MTNQNTTTEPTPPRKSRPSWRRRTASGLVILLVIIALALTALYLNRRLAAQEILVGWLERQGIKADVEVESLELNGFIGKITIGDPNNPQIKVDRVEVDYALGMPWSKQGLGVTPSRIRLVRPVARASMKNGKFSLGSLDPLIEDFTSRPPKPDSRAPIVIIEKGRAAIETDYGPVQLLADAHLDNGRLMALKAVMPRSSLKSGALGAEGLSFSLDLKTRGDQTAISLLAKADQLAQGDLSGRGIDLRLEGTAPYPDAKTRQSRGPIDLSGQLLAQELGQGDVRLNDLSADLGLKGDLKGWIDTFTLAGETRLKATAKGVSAGETRAQNLTLTSENSTLAVSRESQRAVRWQVKGPASLTLSQLNTGETEIGATRLTSQHLSLGGQGGAIEAEGPAQLTSAHIQSGDLDLRTVRGLVQLDMVRDGATRMSLNGNLAVDQGAFNGLGPVTSDDPDELAALKRSLARFSIKAPSVRLRASNAGIELNLLNPITVTPTQGGQLRLEAGATPLMALRPNSALTGSAKLVSEAGGGLPAAQININQWQMTPRGFEARMEGKASLDLGPARGIELGASGLLSTASGITRFVARDCLPVSIRQIELGENDLHTVSAQICPSDAPLLTLGNGRTQVSARLEDVKATVPSVDVELRQGKALFQLDSRKNGLSLTTEVEQLTLADLTDPARFLPVDAAGRIGLANDQWSGKLDLTRNQIALGQITLTHDGHSQEGQLDIQTPLLGFTEHGLQPSDLSPFATQFVQSPVEGSAQFEGQLHWHQGQADSHGKLTIPNLSFASPAGKVEGLRGTINFNSLAPLSTDENQRLWMDRLQTVVPLSNLDVNFSLQEKWLKLAGATIDVASGRIIVEPFDIPLTPNTEWNGVIVVHQVQLNELLKSANLQDKAFLDAVVSGRLPFRFIPDEGWKIIGGQLGSIKPGRLSIAPEVFDELGSDGAAPAEVPPNTMQDLAYQAMQDLAISDLTADVNSLPNGRLGVRFRISGRHDPPEREQLRLTFMELIRRDFLSKKLNLPSDTPIDLTLDTTWNANQIASDLMDYINRGDKP